MHKLTLVIPAKNEKESLPKVLEELKDYNLEIIIVLEENDKETIQATTNYKCKTIFQKNKGYGDALLHGINNVQTKFFCIFNADGSFNPIELREMYEKLNLNKADFIFASRYEKNCSSDDDTVITYIGNFIFTRIGNIFFNLKIDDILYTFVMGRSKSFKSLNLKYYDFRFCVELPIFAKKQSKNYINLGSYERKRFKGKKKVNEFKDGFLILMGMISLFFKRY